MREIIFDTETTGLDSSEDRIIEIGCIELVNRFPTGRSYHKFINPQGRPIHPDAEAVHGISMDRLTNEPIFDDIANEFLDFTADAKLIAHNARFDMGFINKEMSRIGREIIGPERVIDTLEIAKRKHPMGPNSLDALCRRYGIDLSRRTKHGALLDAELLAEVYIELVGGKQAALGLDRQEESSDSSKKSVEISSLRQRPNRLGPLISDEELKAHQKMIEKLGDGAIWKKLAG